MRGRLQSRLQIGVTAALLSIHAIPQAGAQQPAVDPGALLPAVPVAPPERPEPAVPPVAAVQEGAASRAPAGADRVELQLTDVRLVGATLFPEERLRVLYVDRLGRVTPLTTVYDIAAGIERFYRENGWFLTRVLVPPQEIDDGVVRLQVVEGQIREITYLVDPDVGPAAEKVRDYVDHLAAPPGPRRLDEVERWLLLADAVPGLRVSGVLRPARRRDEGESVGGAELVVSVEREAAGEARLLVDNFGSSFTGEARALAAASSFSRTPLAESVTVSGLAAADLDDLGEGQRTAQLVVSLLPGAQGDWIDLTASYGRSIPGGLDERLDFESKTLFLGVEYGRHLWRSRDRNLFASASFGAINSEAEVFGDDLLFRDRLRVAELSLGGDFRDGFGGATAGAVALSKGLPIFGASEEGDDDLSIAESNPEALVVEARAARLQRIVPPFSLFASAEAQYATDALPSDRRFYLGGLRFGRGYNPAALTGDHGVGLTVEPRATHEVGGPWIESVEFFGFHDFGKVWSREPDAEESLSSAGAGLRVFGERWFSAELVAAKPLTLDSERTGGGRDMVVLFRVFGEIDF